MLHFVHYSVVVLLPVSVMLQADGVYLGAEKHSEKQTFLDRNVQKYIIKSI